jgi:hypothetical protein
MRKGNTPRKPAAHLQVSWGYDVTVDLHVSQRNWSKITKRKKVTIRGDGYLYEGEFYWDYWHFEGGIDGKLMVTYSSSKESWDVGVGFDGTAREALVE